MASYHAKPSCQATIPLQLWVPVPDSHLYSQSTWCFKSLPGFWQPTLLPPQPTSSCREPVLCEKSRAAGLLICLLCRIDLGFEGQKVQPNMIFPRRQGLGHHCLLWVGREIQQQGFQYIWLTSNTHSSRMLDNKTCTVFGIPWGWEIIVLGPIWSWEAQIIAKTPGSLKDDPLSVEFASHCYEDKTEKGRCHWRKGKIQMWQWAPKRSTSPLTILHIFNICSLLKRINCI